MREERIESQENYNRAAPHHPRHEHHGGTGSKDPVIVDAGILFEIVAIPDVAQALSLGEHDMMRPYDLTS